MAVALWPIPDKYKDKIKEYSLDVKTEGTLKLDLKNQTAQEFLSCNTGGKNNLFIKINDEFNKKFVARYKGDDLISWRLKNTLSIVKNLEADLKNIATEEKKNNLIALLDRIEQDLQNKFAKAGNNISNKMAEFVEKIKSKTTEIKNKAKTLNIQVNNDNCTADNYVTPKGFIEEKPEVIFVPYIKILKNVFGREFNIVFILICVIAAIICAIKILWLFFGMSAGVLLLVIIINFVESITK